MYFKNITCLTSHFKIRFKFRNFFFFFFVKNTKRRQIFVSFFFIFSRSSLPISPQSHLPFLRLAMMTNQWRRHYFYYFLLSTRSSCKSQDVWRELMRKAKGQCSRKSQWGKWAIIAKRPNLSFSLL